MSSGTGVSAIASSKHMGFFQVSAPLRTLSFTSFRSVVLIDS